MNQKKSLSLAILLTVFSTQAIKPFPECLSAWKNAHINSWAAWVDLKTKNLAAETLKTIEEGKRAVERAERTKAITRLTERKTELTQLLHKGFKADIEYLCKLPLTWTPEEKLNMAIKAGKVTAQVAGVVIACYATYHACNKLYTHWTSPSEPIREPDSLELNLDTCTTEDPEKEQDDDENNIIVGEEV